MKKKTPAASGIPKTSVLLYCPSDLILAGILKSLETDETIEVVNKVILFASAEAMPNMREICKAIRDISKDQIKTQMLLLGNIPSHEEIVSLINVGARGYFDLNDPSGQLPEAVRVLAKGEIWLPRDKMSSIMDRIISVVGREIKEKTLDQLTPTEFQVLKLIGQGKSNDEIAAGLFISKNTVRSHIKSIYAKLDTHSRLQLALYAINSALF